MDKTQLLALVQQKINEGVLTQEDMSALVYSSETKPQVHTKNITNIFYIIGAIIAVIGVVILLAQNWTDIGFVGRVLSTLGISIVSFVIGYVMTGSVNRVLSQVFFTIAGILAPLGVLVFCREFDFVFSTLVQTCTALGLFALFYMAFYYTRRNILILWNMLWITWAYFSFLSYMFMLSGDLLKVATMVLGITYLCITYHLQSNVRATDNVEEKEKRRIETMLYTAGVMLILIPALFFDGLFDLVTLLLIFGAFYLSIFVKSRFTLIVSGILLVAYILKITSKYFVDSIGWPVALIGIGFLVIAIGYGTLYVSRTYIPKIKN